MARHWKKHKSHKMGGVRKVMRGVGTVAAGGFIVAPLAIPLLSFGSQVSKGVPATTAMVNSIYTATGIGVQDGSIDYGKLTKFAIGSGALILVGIGLKKYVVKRL